ncbi:hypothetical protein HBH70_049390 [Parastagonospora nodorum]|nr:hypothetical protein HBH43_065100 [Parastagonospora nodorum]KAH4212318.1 hypothetical protein HBI95_035780 [Parastagonospora nodorum]KAH4813360.1 hypothetical protein HBH61_078040 [Parastagonospora nodorum]KAH4958591.1 hypothetical protein HBI78_177960 [Parastagonospora nodorum]KAH5146140.1 hypothetical protein HBH70_049390 [Parastagonospora nodorum]
MARRRVQSPKQSGRPNRREPAEEAEANSDEEAANTESQKILALASLLKKPKTDDKDLQQFRAKVAADRERLKAHLDQRVHQAEESETRRRDEITSTILNALTTLNRDLKGEAPTFAGTKITENAVYMPLIDVLSSSEALLEEYERLDKMIMDMRDEQEEPVPEAWHQDIQDAEKKLQMGARVALRNVKKVLGADVENDEGATAEDGDAAMQDNEGELELNYELEKSLRYAERGVRRMVKGLPGVDA